MTVSEVIYKAEFMEGPGVGVVLLAIYWEAKWVGFCCPEQGEGNWGMGLIKSYERELAFLRLASEWG